MAIRVDSVEDMIPLADFIADVAGESVEVVLHDIRDAETSIRYIRNGCLSGRQIGDGTTDAALKLIQDGRAESRDYVANYSGKSLENHEFRCATYFIKNPEDQLIGLLCVNVLVDGLREVIELLESYLTGRRHDSEEQAAHHGVSEENLLGNPTETIRLIARNVLRRYEVDPLRLSRQERVEAVRAIYEEGVFLMKGSVQTVAEEMDISVPTLYKYLQEVRG